ncbi:hypothetical protein [Ralstonia mannitolilytica]|uniref:hypothetical protein n=1 Tax=Ralstonia mannitolilytica TaxID=105219 RepID=UPI0037486574
MSIQGIFADIEVEHSARRDRECGVLRQRNEEDRIAEITKHLGDAWAGNDFRAQMLKVAATAIEAIEQFDILKAQREVFYSQLKRGD